MNRILRFSIFSFILTIVFACNQKTNNPIEALIPIPVNLEMGKGNFTLTEKTILYTETSHQELMKIAEAFQTMVKKASNLEIAVQPIAQLPKEGESNGAGTIVFEIDSSIGNGNSESYSLQVTSNSITLKAAKPAGIFYGMQTLRQLLPHEIETSNSGISAWQIPAVTITDHPEYAYRGSMLDVSRHFFSVDEVKHYIDLLSFYKMNALHLHLSDDQGWRIEIKSWPNLTAVGGTTQVGGGKGGFYSQEEYKDIVQYAADRYITIIPEIDMPGHTNAALASYAELNCNDTATKLYTGIEVGFSTLCTNKEVTFRFLDSVIRELSALTPGPYIHIGGDESHATKIEDYIPFMEKVQKMVSKYGKKVIGWDEIAHCQLESNTLAQYWANAENANRAIQKGARLIISPAKKTYMDMKYDSTTQLGLNWAGFIEIDTAYLWDPTTIEAGIKRKDIEGVEAPLWSETIVSRNDIEYMTFPRLPGYAEIAWSPVEKRNWDNYKNRLSKHATRMEKMGIAFYRSPKVPWIKN